jgi:hypothetical protein
MASVEMANSFPMVFMVSILLNTGVSNGDASADLR